MATCEARPACDARRTACSFVRFLPPLLTPHGGAASPPSFTRAGAAGEDTPHCATRDARRAPRAGPVTVSLRPLVTWVSRFLLLLVTLGLALSYICMCAMRRPRLARELNLARSAQKKRKNYLKKREKRTSAIHPLPGFFSVFAFVRAVEEGALSRRTRGRARGVFYFPTSPAIRGNRPLALASTLHRAPVGQGPPGPSWLAIPLGFWSGRALATGTTWPGLCFIHHQPPCPCFVLKIRPLLIREIRPLGTGA